MQEPKYRELEERASAVGESDLVRRMETIARVHGVIEEMKADGTAFALTDEEVRMLESFRRFKVRMRRDGAVFTWQTRLPVGVQIVGETAEIVHPAEVMHPVEQADIDRL